MNYIILDLEWNGSYSKSERKFINEIIEFGAVKVDNDFNIIDTFSTLIIPQIGKKICNRVSELTKITNDELKDNGITFQQASEMFTEFSSDCVIMTWGNSDIHALIDNYMYYYNDYHVPFLKKYCDIQKYCEKSMGIYNASQQIGLSTCAEELKVDFSEEEHHRATADAVLSLKCVKKLIDKYPIQDYIEDTDNDDFYHRIKFKAHFITDLNSPEIDKSQLEFNCKLCGGTAKRTSKWKSRNKGFSANFECNDCKRAFIGRVYFKKKYDGIQVNKKVYYKPEPDENTDCESKGNKTGDN